MKPEVALQRNTPTPIQHTGPHLAGPEVISISSSPAHLSQAKQDQILLAADRLKKTHVRGMSAFPPHLSITNPTTLHIKCESSLLVSNCAE